MGTYAAAEKSKSTATVAVPKNKQQSFFAPLKVQPKLTIGAVDDPYEREADAMADKVMRMPEKQNPHPEPGTFVLPFFAPDQVQRKCADCEKEEKLQKKSNGIAGEGIAAPSLVHEVLNSGGQPLDAGTRNFFEPRFGQDFENVKIHTGNKAAVSSQSINAHAYTSGSNIVFNEGKYNPGTEGGKRLLGHELTHVLQNRKSTISRAPSGTGDDSGDTQNDEPLKTRLLNTETLQNAAQNAPTIKQGTHGDDIKRIQSALRLLGMPLEDSFTELGPDGKYGPDTAGNVRQFQVDESISPPGGFEVGKRTLHRMDALLIQFNLDPQLAPITPTPIPPVPKPQVIPNIVSCTPEKTKIILEALSAALIMMNTANQRVFTDRIQAGNASFIMFRSRLQQTIAEASRNLQKAISIIPKIEFRCALPENSTCEASVPAFSLNFNLVCFLCPTFFSTPKVRTRTLIHEAMHLGAGLQRPGLIFDPEHSLDFVDPLKELEAELDTATRIRNADHNAGFVIALATIADLNPIANHRAGADLDIGLVGSKTSIRASGPTAKLRITGNDDFQVGIPVKKWKVTDNFNNPVRITQLDEIDEALISRVDRDRLVAAGVTKLFVEINLEVTGVGAKTLTKSISVDRP